MGRKKQKPKVVTQEDQRDQRDSWTIDRRQFLTLTLSDTCVALVSFAVIRLFPPMPSPQPPAPPPIAAQPPRNQVVTPTTGAIEIRGESVRLSEKLHVQVIRPQVASHSATNSSTTNLRDYLRD